MAGFVQEVEANAACIEQYKTAFKGHLPVHAKDVAAHYNTYCKKSMKSGSTKSMDELCRPIVKKVESKMTWVPADDEVTPEIVCKTVEQIKEMFPDHAAKQGESEAANKKQEDAAEAEKKVLSEKAKALTGNIQKELADVFSIMDMKSEKTKDLKNRINKQVLDVLGGEMDARKEKMVTKILETITLGMRGLETKAKQKTDESLKEWLVSEMKEKAKAKTEL